MQPQAPSSAVAGMSKNMNKMGQRTWEKIVSSANGNNRRSPVVAQMSVLSTRKERHSCGWPVSPSVLAQVPCSMAGTGHQKSEEPS